LQAGTIAWSQAKAKAWLTILDTHILGDKPFLCGNEITLADYFAAPVLTAADLIAFDFSPYPNVARWLERIKARDGWKISNAAFYGLVDQVRAAPAAA